MKAGFYGDYYYSLLERNDMSLVNECIDHWATKHTENILAERDDLKMFSIQMLIAATAAAHVLTTGNRTKAMRAYMIKKAGREND